MVVGTRLVDQGGEVYVSVVTDNGGDQTYGPYRSSDVAMSVLRARLSEDFDTEFDPGTHEVVPFDPTV